MFSRYRKPGADGPAMLRPAPEPEPMPAPAPPPAPDPVAVPRMAARAEAPDKERRRKDKLAEVKVRLHTELLDNLSLAALDKASEEDLKAEITAVASETLTGMGMVLSQEERTQLNQEHYDEVKGLGPLEPLLKDDSVNDILVNGPSQIFVERTGRLELTDIAFKDSPGPEGHGDPLRRLGRVDLRHGAGPVGRLRHVGRRGAQGLCRRDAKQRVMRAEEKANTLPTKMTLATMMLTVPPLLIILLGPSVYNIAMTLGSVGQ